MEAKNIEAKGFTWKWLYKVSGVAALLLGGAFLVAMVSLITTIHQPGASNEWLLLFQNNWLMVLFKLNAGVEGTAFENLHGLNGLDIGIMALVAVTYVGLCFALRRISKVWSIIAAALLVLGILVFIATKLAGRSGVMAAGLIISILLLRSDLFGKMTASIGILACVFLLVGDFGTSESTHSAAVAALVGAGYVLLTIWFLLIGRKLLMIHRIAKIP